MPRPQTSAMGNWSNARKVALGLAVFSLVAGLAVSLAETLGKERVPVIFVTDIGTDIDDTWALALLLRSPEFDLKLVVVDPADTGYRALVAAKFLQSSGRGAVPLAIGDNTGPKADDLRTLTPWIAGYSLAQYPGKVHRDGVAALIETIEQSPEPLTIVATGPAHSLALALARAPQIAAKCRFVGSFGSFRAGDDGGAPSAENNVRVDPAAFRSVMAAPWREILIAPLDTTGVVRLSGTRYHAIWCATQDPMLRAVIESYCIFAPRQIWTRCDYFTERTTTLYDCVAVHLARTEKCLQLREVAFDVGDDGFTRESPTGHYRARVALSWDDLDGFEADLANRLLAPSK